MVNVDSKHKQISIKKSMTVNLQSLQTIQPTGGLESLYKFQCLNDDSQCSSKFQLILEKIETIEITFQLQFFEYFI